MARHPLLGDLRHRIRIARRSRSPDLEFGYDEQIESSLRSGSPSALQVLDVALGQELWAHDVPALVALGERVSGPVSAEMDYADDPHGVQYWVVRWTCGS